MHEPQAEGGTRDEAGDGAGDRALAPAPGPLAHLLVLDLTTARSGPTCVRQLADLGARVIQVSSPHRGDIGGSDGANLGRNKQSAIIDLKEPAGREVLLRLVDRADVLVENMRPAVKHRLGIGPDVLLARNPRLVYASLSGFGQSGPYAHRPAVDQIVQGMGGLMSVTGPPGTGPWRAGTAVSDTVAGTFLAQGVLAALIARVQHGRGQWVHTSLLESMINLMDFQACRYVSDGEVPAQEGNNHPTFFPMGTYRTADGWINIGGLRSIDAFLDAIDAPDLLHDPRFADPATRRAHRDEFNAACEARLVDAPSAHWVERLLARGIPAGPVYAMDEVFADPQVRHLDLVREVPTAEGTARVLRYPVTLSATPASVRSGPPAGGAHTRAVLEELGYTAAEIEDLVAAGAVATSGAGRASWLG